MFLKRFKSLQNPDMYHGWGKQKSYFEGWYFKLIDPTEQYAIAVIPGISMSKTGEKHSFIQILDGKKCTAEYLTFDADDFQPDENRFFLNLKENQFSADFIQLDLNYLKGKITFQDTQPIDTSIISPGIMGIFSYIPFMECYHGVVSMNHRLKGSLEIDGKEVDFTGGKGYLEKDWGKSFPNSWIWMQTNHFEHHEASLMVSVAKIPFLGFHFNGFLISLWIEGKFYRFATYTGAVLKSAKVLDNRVELVFKNGKMRLEVVAYKGATGELISPISGNMTGKVNESIDAKIHLKLFKKDQLIFDDYGNNAGLEVAGPYEELLK